MFGCNWGGTARFIERTNLQQFVSSLSALARERFLPTNLRRVSRSMWVASSHSSWEGVIGLSAMSFSFLFFPWNAFIVLSRFGNASTSKRAKSAGRCVSSQCSRHEVFLSFPLFADVCLHSLLSHVLSEQHVLSNLIHRSSGHIQ